MGNIVLFGSGYFGRVATEIIDAQEIAFFVDNDDSKSGSCVSGIPVFSFNEKKYEMNDFKVVICLSEEKCEEVERQLNDNGISNHITIHDLRQEVISKRLDSSKNNIEIYNNAIGWIYKNTIDDKGIVNFTGMEEVLPYPEVTGYFIPSLIRWGYRELALKYAKWLVQTQNEDGSWSDVYGGKPYIFDTAQILKGLIAAKSIGLDGDNSILKGCDWILSRMLDSGRLLQEDTSAWDFKQNPDIELIHIYCLSPIIDSGKAFDRPDYIEKAKKILEYYKNQYLDSIRNFGMLSHFYAYVIEGLIDIGESDLAEEAMKSVEKLQRDDGFVPGMPNVNWTCSTGLFQFAIIWYRLGNVSRGKKAFDYACHLQNISGGWYGSYSINGQGGRPPYFPDQEISWAVKFFLDALFYKNKAEFDSRYEMFLDDIDVTDERYQIIRNEINNRGANQILDIGCGKGRYIKNILKETNKEIYAVDISYKVMQGISDVVTKKIGTLTDIPYDDHVFDFTYTCEALEHAIDIENAIQEMVRVTKTGGAICVIDKNADELGLCSIEEWEQWFDIDSLKSIMYKYCRNVYVIKSISHETIPDNLFCAWIGEV